MTDAAFQMANEPLPGWLDDHERVAPTVLILGGFLTAPPLYARLARHLRERGAAAVVVAGVWTPDWLLASVRGTGPLTTRSARALLAAIARGRDVSRGAPLLLVGHSAGGITARLLTAPEPFPGRRFGAAGRIGAIVTLGTPHQPAGGGGIGRRFNEVASSVAQRAVPGAFFTPRTGYLSVASSSVRGDPAGNGRERVAHLLYRSVLGRSAQPGIEGDGLVPVSATTLPGAGQIVLERALHGPTSGGPWYGSEDQVELWWPAAKAAWREALKCRAVSVTTGALAESTV